MGRWKGKRRQWDSHSYQTNRWKRKKKTFIATGKGLEGAIPDITCKEIVDNEMLPSFKNKKHFEGINNALVVITALAKRRIQSQGLQQKK